MTQWTPAAWSRSQVQPGRTTGGRSFGGETPAGRSQPPRGDEGGADDVTGNPPLFDPWHAGSVSPELTTSSTDQTTIGSRPASEFNGGFGQPFPAGYHRYSAALLESFRPFVPPGGLDRVAAALRRGPVTVVRGPGGAGKQAAALSVLASLGVERFYAVDPDVRFRILDLRLVPAGSGLVLDGLSCAAADRLRRADLDRVGQMLAGRGSWLVLTVNQGMEWADPELAGLTVDLPGGPPIRDVVQVHLRDGLGAARAGTARALPAHPGAAGRLANLPGELTCADAAALGRLLARYAGDPDAAAERLGLLAGSRAERELVDWFGALADSATRFFALALTFAEGEPMETVAAVAESLERAFRASAAGSLGGDEEEAGRARCRVGGGERSEGAVECAVEGAVAGAGEGNGDPFRSGRSGPLRDIRALAGDHIVRTRSGPPPQQRAEFVERDYGDRLLRHAWTEYPRIRPALLSVIAQLGTHPSAPVRRRAVASVGALARADGAFGQLLAAIVEPWALAEDPGRNEAAALALWSAGAANPDLRRTVQALVGSWARSDVPELRATAVWALGRAICLVDSPLVAAVLTEMAADEHDTVIDAVCHALTLGVDAPGDEGAQAAAMTVFELLGGWVENGPDRARRVAELTVLTMATHLVRYRDPRCRGGGGKGVGSQGAQAARDATQPPWPGLLWLAERSPELGRRAGRLWAAALSSPEYGRPARRLLTQWAAQAEPRRRRREALARLLFAAAGHEPARRVLARQAGNWAKGPDAAAPRTGALVTQLLNIS